MTEPARLPIRPDRYAVFAPEPEVPFHLVTAPGWEERFDVTAASGVPAGVRVWEPGEELADVLATLPEPAHVLVAAPGRLVTSPEPAAIGRRKLVCVPAGSTPMPVAALAAALVAFEATDPDALERRADAFFSTVGEADHLEVVDERHGTKATLHHLDDDYAWNQQAGPVYWGEQQIAPAGELSVLPADLMGFDPDRRLALDGELTLRGTPIVHGGAAPYEPDDQERLYRALRHLEDAAVTLVVAGGTVVDHQAASPEALPAADALGELFDRDERYRVVLEVGFGIHPTMALQPGNCAVNEVHGGRHGVLHLGVGLTPDTTYAPIVLCPDATVRTDDGRFVAGARSGRGTVRRVKSPTCGCG